MHEVPGQAPLEGAPKFELGRVLMTRGIQALVIEERCDPWTLVQRHVIGDWGDLDEEDRLANEASIHNGGRLMSAYRIDDSLTVWVITEAGREVTTVLLPSEY